MNAMFHYSKSRLIGISDGVFAVVLTIMVLDIKSPVSTARGPMIDLIKHLLIYFISFGIVSEYWVYHQELLSGIKRTTPLLTITNIYYLVFISLTPFATGWLNDAFMERMPSMAYSVVIILVNFTQAVMFHEVVDIGEEDGMKMTAHDREEYLHLRSDAGNQRHLPRLCLLHAKIFSNCHLDWTCLKDDRYPCGAGNRTDSNTKNKQIVLILMNPYGIICYNEIANT